MMDVISVATSAAVGLPVGTVLRGQVARMSVPSGEPEEMTCRECAAALPRRPAIRCWHCGSWIGAPMAIEVVTAAVLALLAARIGFQPALGAAAFLAILGVALAQVDVAVQRLPDRLTLPAYPGMIVLLALAAAADDAWPGFARALLGGLALGAAYLVLGWLGWGTLLAGASLGFVTAAAVGLVLLTSRRISRRAMISFGPYMLAGAFLAVLTGR